MEWMESDAIHCLAVSPALGVRELDAGSRALLRRFLPNSQRGVSGRYLIPNMSDGFGVTLGRAGLRGLRPG